MEATSSTGVLSHLSALEAQARSRKTESQQQSRVKELRAKAEALMVQRDQLRAEVDAHKHLTRLRMAMEKHTHEEKEDMDEDSENSQLLHLMARHTQLNDLLYGHHIIGGYDIIKSPQGKGVCVSLTTAYEGTYLDTYNLELNMKQTLTIVRHNIPPFIPLKCLAKESNMQTNIRAFLYTLSQHLNAFAGRKQQLKLIKEEHKSVEVMESNLLCSILVLMFTVPRTKTAVLCTLDYTDHNRCLPTQVRFECEDEELPDSPEWKKNCSLLKETPVHKALLIMKKMGSIV